MSGISIQLTRGGRPAELAIEEVKSEQRRISERLDDESAQIGALTARSDELQAENLQLRAENERLKADLARLEARLKVAEAENAQLHRAKQECEDEMARVREELARVNRDLVAVQKDLRAARRKEEQQEQRITRLERDFDYERANTVALRSQVEASTLHIAELEEAMHNQRGSLRDAKSGSQQLQLHLEEARSDAAAAAAASEGSNTNLQLRAVTCELAEIVANRMKLDPRADEIYSWARLWTVVKANDLRDEYSRVKDELGISLPVDKALRALAEAARPIAHPKVTMSAAELKEAVLRNGSRNYGAQAAAIDIWERLCK
jgi:chromosome segregation ATPase